MADALVEGDVDGLVELSDLLKASGTSEKTTDFVLQLMFECLLQRPKNARRQRRKMGVAM